MRKFLVALLLFACTKTGDGKATQTNEPTDKAQPTTVAPVPMPTFSLTKLDGTTVASAELTGKPAMVNFWHPS